MKKAFVIAILLELVSLVCRAEPKVQLITYEGYQLNSYGRPGGVKRICTPILLPPRTIAVFYTIQTARRRMPTAIDLATQLTNIITARGLTKYSRLASLASRVQGTVGEGAVHVFVMDNADAGGAFLANKKKFSYWNDYSRASLSNGTIGIKIEPEPQQRKLYIGVSNASFTQAISYTLEVAVITEK